MHRYDPEQHHRHSIRLPGYDYTQPGAYFVTICTHEHAHLFGRVVDGEMVLNELGEIVRTCWDEIPAHFPHLELDAFVVMPNHVHGILWIVDNHVGARHAVPLQHAVPPRRRRSPTTTEQFGKPVPGSVSTIIRSFKSAVTKRINAQRGTPGASVWQRNLPREIIRRDSMAYYYVYVLLSQKDSQFYVGYTNNLQKRVREHNPV